MHRRLLSLRSRRAAFVAASVPFAYQVRQHNTQSPVLDPIAENEKAEKSWELDGASSYAINRIKIDAPGLAVVSYAKDGHDSVGRVRVSGDSTELVECMEVVPLPPNGVQLRFKSKECENIRGHLLTSLTVAKEGQVNDIHIRGNGTVVVEDGVIVSDCEHADVKVALEGSGALHVLSSAQDLKLKALQLKLAGSGTLQFIGPQYVSLRDQLLNELAGTGTMHFFAGKIEAPLIKTSIAGAGAVTIVPSEELSTHKLKTSIAGTGSATYTGNGQATVQRCSIAGSGTVHAGGIVCQDASVSGVGQSEMTWQVTESIKASGWGSHTIKYVNGVPKSVDGKSVSLKPASVDKEPERITPSRIPTREDAFDKITAEYEQRVGRIEGATDVGRAVNFVRTAFFGDVDCEEDTKSDEKRKTRRERRQERTSKSEQ